MFVSFQCMCLDNETCNAECSQIIYGADVNRRFLRRNWIIRTFCWSCTNFQQIPPFFVVKPCIAKSTSVALISMTDPSLYSWLYLRVAHAAVYSSNNQVTAWANLRYQCLFYLFQLASVTSSADLILNLIISIPRPWHATNCTCTGLVPLGSMPNVQVHSRSRSTGTALFCLSLLCHTKHVIYAIFIGIARW